VHLLKCLLDVIDCQSVYPFVSRVVQNVVDEFLSEIFERVDLGLS